MPYINMSEQKAPINQIINGKRHGYWNNYFWNKNLSWEGTYHKDEFTGHWKFYHKNGTLEKERIFIR